MRKLMWTIYAQPLNRIILFIALIVFIWGIIGKLAEKMKWWKPLNATLLLCETIAIVYITLYSREVGSREVILAPFHSFVEAKKQSEMYRTMMMNVFLFVPMGLFLPNMLPSKWHLARNILIAILLGFTLSAVVEYCQFRFSLGRCEVDDVIMNSIGTAIGASSYIVAKKSVRGQKA